MVYDHKLSHTCAVINSWCEVVVVENTKRREQFSPARQTGNMLMLTTRPPYSNDLIQPDLKVSVNTALHYTRHLMSIYCVCFSYLMKQSLRFHFRFEHKWM